MFPYRTIKVILFSDTERFSFISWNIHAARVSLPHICVAAGDKQSNPPDSVFWNHVKCLHLTSNKEQEVPISLTFHESVKLPIGPTSLVVRVSVRVVARVIRGQTNVILPLKSWWIRCTGHCSLLESSGGRFNGAATRCCCLLFKISNHYTLYR